jgi:hypothetical protein
MDKRCAGCIWRVYREQDEYETFPYCSHIETRMRSFFNSAQKCTNAYIKDKFRHLRDDERYSPLNLWSCQVVQTVYDGNCPHKEVRDGEVN